MTYTGDPGASDKDNVRFLIGDTDDANEMLSDAEIEYLVTLHGNAYQAAITACRRLAAKFAREVSRTIGRLSIAAAERMRHYQDLASQLEMETGTSAGGASLVYAGGISIADKQTQEDDTDRVEPFFTRDMPQ